MNMIDEKGRIGGKINIIDLLILLIVLGALCAGVYKMGFLKTAGTNQPEKKAVITFMVQKVLPNSAEAIQVGDMVSELRSNNQVGKVIRKEVKNAVDQAPDQNGKWVISELPNKRDITIWVETLAPYTEDLKLGSVNAKVGAKIEIKGPKFQLESYIVGVEQL